LLGLDDAWAANEKELAAAHGDLVGRLADIEWIGHKGYLTIAASTQPLPPRRGLEVARRH